VWKAVAVEPAAPTTFENLLANYRGIPAAAWKSTQANITSNTLATPPLEILLGPNTKMPYEKSIVEVALKKITGIFKNFAQPPKQTTLFYNYKDLKWATDTLSTFSNPFRVTNTFPDKQLNIAQVNICAEVLLEIMQ
jgi:hypothetical protein